MDPEYTEAIRLLWEARRADPDVTELRGKSGRVAVLERAPEPGIDIALSDPADSVWLVLALSACDERPSRYPEGIPWVANHAASVVMRNEKFTVNWRGTEGIVCGLPSTADEAVVKRMMDAMGPVIEMAKGGDTVAPSEIAERGRAFLDSLDPAERDQLASSMRPDPEVVAKLQRIFEVACADSESTGWQEVERKEKTEPAVTANVRYEMAGMERVVTLLPIGASGGVLLRQGVAGAAA